LLTQAINILKKERINHKGIKEEKGKMEKKIFAEALTIILLASMILAVIPVQAQTMSIQISPSKGPVGTEVTVTGTIVTYNGDYELWFDADNDDLVDAGETVTGTSDGYDVDVTFTIPNAYQGARKFRLTDLSAAGEPYAEAYFTVETSYSLSVSPGVNYEGGGFTFTATITGGKEAWPAALDLQIRVKDPDGATVKTDSTTNLAEVAVGKFETTWTYGPGDSEIVTWGTWTAYLDWATDATTWTEGVATTTFTVRLTDASSYGRTETVSARAYVSEAGTYYYKIYDFAGELVDESSAITMAAAGFLPVETWVPPKDEDLGTYTVKILKDTTVVKEQTFNLMIAELTVDFLAGGTVGDIERTLTATVDFQVLYPSGSVATSADIPGGFKVTVFYNTTLVAEVELDPLTDYSVTGNRWTVSWKIPKDAVEGINYCFNVTVNAITDAYGNKGPAAYASSGEDADVGYFNVIPAVLSVTVPSLVYPGAGATLQRSLEARASFQVAYPDGSKLTAADFEWVNATVTGPSDYTVSMTAEDYNEAVGLWIAKWVIPYDATLGDYSFYVKANAVTDIYGNKGPSSNTGTSSSFTVGVATLTVENFATDQIVYETDSEVTITFEGSYPSGVAVTTGSATIEITSGGTSYGTVTANYDSTIGKFVAKWIVPSNAPSGLYNATIDVDEFADDATPVNDGPTVAKWVNFNVTRISLTSVINRIEALDERITTLETALTDLESTIESLKVMVKALKVEAITAAIQAVEDEVAALKSDIAAAKQAASDAGAVAGQAKSSADAATQAANSAASAAADAKSAAQAAQSAAQGVMTAVYGAIILSLIAALASIVAVITLQRKVA
jgi:hypothetical protein